MKKITGLIALITLIGTVCFAGQTVSNLTLVGSITLAEDEYTTGQVGDAVGDAVNQWGAAGYSVPTNVTVAANTWTDVPASFTIPYVSGFEYLSGSTVTYTNGARDFLFLGSCSLQTTSDNGALIQVGLETNGVFVVGSSSGERSFSIGTAGSMSYLFPLMLEAGDTIGLVVRSDSAMTITINTWQSGAIRF